MMDSATSLRYASVITVLLAGCYGTISVPGGDPTVPDGRGADAGAGVGTEAGKRPEPGNDKATTCPSGTPMPVDEVRIVPLAGKRAVLRGARIQGSNTSPANDFVDLAGIDPSGEAPAIVLKVPRPALYRYLKVYSAERSDLSIAELTFLNGGVALSGRPFGTPGGIERAFDGNDATGFSGTLPTGNYVGVDIGSGAVTAAPVASPNAGAFDAAQQVSLQSATRDATIRYTLDGSTPTPTTGVVYKEPIALKDGLTSLKAIAYADCLFASEVISGRYAIGEAAKHTAATGLKSYHIGNSLTDTINAWLKPIADSTGVEHTYARWMSVGATIGALWKNPGMGFAAPPAAGYIREFARTFAPIDHMTVQPFADPSLDLEGDAAVQMFELVRAHSPDVQAWIYAQWPARSDYTADSLVVGAAWARPAWNVTPPQSWEDAVHNQLLYHEAFRAYVDEHVAGKSVRVVPGGPALVALKAAIERGEVPGIRSFFDEHFDDDLHLSTKGQYLIGLVFYACLYGQSPVGRVTTERTGLSDAQARIYQQIAWDTVSRYPFSGVSP
jgi:hypothetical protein